MNAKRAQAQQWRGEVEAIAQRAGEAILEIYRGSFDVSEKEDRTPLTQADLAAHRCIVDGLTRLTPDIPVLSEESAAIDFSTRSSWSRYWLVDPLDGTREFIKRNGEFTVNIALIDVDAPMLGVVYQPVTQYLASAVRGHGAFAREGEGRWRELQVRELPEGPVRVAGSRSHADARQADFLARLGEHELVPMGSSLKFCLIAEGRADLYLRLGPTSEWDTAAAQCVLEEAGGQVTDTALQPLRYNTKDSLLNPDFFAFGDASRRWNQYLA